MTPRQFDYLVRNYEAKKASNELLFAQIVSMVANTGFRSFEKPTHPRDFMPSEWNKKRHTYGQSDDGMTQEQRDKRVADKLRAFFNGS